MLKTSLFQTKLSSIFLALAFVFGAPTPNIHAGQAHRVQKKAAIANPRVGRQPKLTPQKQPQELTAEEAARKIGRKVYFATGSATPISMVPLIRRYAVEREGRTDAFFMSTFASAVNFKPELKEKFHAVLLFISMSNRDAATGGWTTMPRDNLFSLGKRLRANEFGIDTIVVRVSPPDENGMVSLGTTGDTTMPAVESVIARGGTIIAEMNPNVPYMKGTNRIPLHKISYLVKSQEPLSELQQVMPNEIETEMSTNIAKLVPDGATIQVGIGGTLSGLGTSLLGKKRLRAWSEMGTDSWILPLMQGETPVLKGGTFSFLHGTSSLYAFAANNDKIQIADATVVNDPAVIATQPNMRSINTALQVDTSGNTNAEQIDGKVISAAGGQPNFMEGAAASKTGRSIMALRSLNKHGASTVVISLQGPVTTKGSFVDHVTTEWGNTPLLRNMAPQSKTFELIKIAHPAHRASLAKAALTQGLISNSQRAAIDASVLPALLAAPLSFRKQAADVALSTTAITASNHAAIIATIPAPN